VSSALAEIDRHELHARMERGDELILVDALGPISYGAAHLPGAINIPPDRVDAIAARRIPNRNHAVVVYCAGPDCVSSVEVAERLLELGYRNVLHYAGGKRDWTDAGLPLEPAEPKGARLTAWS
jgi:rhodanese-related sulfurtransferase